MPKIINKPRLLIATNNKGKEIELQSILKGIEIDLVLPADIGLKLDVEEDGLTYAENAAKKAQAFSQASGLPAIADDTGLEVHALEGEPGLHSNRYGPKPQTDESRRAFLLLKLRSKPRPWTAEFRATVAVVSPEGSVKFAEGICPGEVVPEGRGEGGFGYDPIFQLADTDHTMAELDMTEKNRLSHRGQAVRAVIPMLIEMLGI